MSPTGRAKIRRSARVRHNHGYALVEVLVAATLLGVVLAVLMEGFSQGLAALTYLNERWVAVTLARGLAAQPNMVGRPGQGRFDYPFDRYSWTVEKSRVTVAWPAGGGKRFMLPVPVPAAEVRRKGETPREGEPGQGTGPSDRSEPGREAVSGS